MPRPTVYVETSVWGSLAPRHPRDRKQVVRRLLRLLQSERGVCVVSDVVLRELKLAPQEARDEIERYLATMQPVIYDVTAEVESLARKYLLAAILPERREADAVHVAAATCLGADYLVSWNHRHITRPSKKLQFELVNRLNGYANSPAIGNPFEVCDEL